MILRNTDGRSHDLEKEMTVGEFIKEIIEKDEERDLKYYRISLKANLHSRNMVLLYQNGILKSHHTTGSKLDYNDYLNYKIWESYGANYISIDNIWDYKKDFSAEDGNKPEKIENKARDPKKLKEICDKTFEKIKREDEARAKVNKIKWNLKNEKITFEDLLGCIRQMTWDMDKHVSDEYSKNWGIERMQRENEILQSQVEWLEYKIDLLQKKNGEKKDDELFNPDNLRF